MGGNSGAGSYNQIGVFKAEIMNDFVKENKVKTVIEFGFGDGQQLTRATYPHYIGLDVSKTIHAKTSKRFEGDSTKEFRLYDGDVIPGLKEDLTLSFGEDATYFMFSFTSAERFCFIKFVQIRSDRNAATRLSYCETVPSSFSLLHSRHACHPSFRAHADVIYHLVEDEVYHKYMAALFAASTKYVVVYSSNIDGWHGAAHVLHRDNTKYIAENFPDWRLLGTLRNKYAARTAQDFFFCKVYPAILLRRMPARSFTFAARPFSRSCAHYYPPDPPFAPDGKCD